MGWSIGFDAHWDRVIGYGVPAYCDHPGCEEEIDRGLAYVCGGEPYGGEHGCGLYFCAKHLGYRHPRGEDGLVQNCKRCRTYRRPYTPSAEHPTWIEHVLTDPSWAEWRAKHPSLAARYAERYAAEGAT